MSTKKHLNFLCIAWGQNEKLKLTVSSNHPYLGGGSMEETGVLVLNCTVNGVAAFQCTQQEADTKVTVHLVHIFQKKYKE